MKTLTWRIIMAGFMCVQGLLFSYTSFGLAARTMADLLTRSEMDPGAARIEHHPILSASMGSRRPSVSFVRNGEPELLRVGYMPELA
ncbi:MAG: hypothetical protein JNM62_08060 [Flavobacteriales bacterium]|nr:hypothetical protein [Flavobacteriales bacterium]